MPFLIKNKIKIITLLLVVGISHAQKREAERNNFDHYAYMVSIPTYEELADKGFTVEEICKNLGNAYYLNAAYAEAALWYEKLFQFQPKNLNPDYFYRYAQSLKSIEKYKESEEWMRKFADAKSNDLRAVKFSEQTRDLEEIITTPQKFAITNQTGVNSVDSDFAPSFLQNDLVFSSLRSQEEEHKKTKKRYLNLFKSQAKSDGAFVGASVLSEVLSTGANESSSSFSSDGTTVYFTRNNSKKGLFKRDKQGISRLKIYRSKWVNDHWDTPEDLSINSGSYSTAHPSLSSDGSKLYFSSDMPGSHGASDIFVVVVNADGSLGIPQNLGPKVNTEGKETFPFISDSNVLYFSSDGHPGLGGLDIFSIDIENGGLVANMGKPVNSVEDDFSLIIDGAGEKGFFASNRHGGLGSDDIYGLKNITSCFTLVSGTILDKNNREPISGALVTVLADENTRLAQTVSAEDGTFTIEIECQKGKYRLLAGIEGFENGTFDMLNSPPEKEITGIEIELEPTEEKVELGTDLAKALRLTPIYFDLNSSYIRQDALPDLNKVVDYMLQNPIVRIEVRSHTDSRSGDAYNQWLSNRRAKRTVGYIISKGIDTDRISGVGFGENQLINYCKNGVPCTDAEHQLNRRSEFIVIHK